MSDRLSAAVVSVLVLVFIIELLRRRQLKEKYAILWLFVGIALLVLLLLPGLLTDLSAALGFELPVNFLFMVTLMLLLGVSMHLSWELSRAEEETRSLAEDVAILRLQVEQELIRRRPPTSEKVNRTSEG